jgi:hypothetical protein
MIFNLWVDPYGVDARCYEGNPYDPVTYVNRSGEIGRSRPELALNGFSRASFAKDACIASGDTKWSFLPDRQASPEHA